MVAADHFSTGSWPAFREYDPVEAWRALLDGMRGIGDDLERLDKLESDRPPPLDGTEDTLESH